MQLDSLRSISVMTVITKFSTALSLLKHSRFEKRHPGARSLVGHIGRVEIPIGAHGSVYVRGELWPARADSPIASGEKVRVIGLNSDGLFLVVEQLPF